MWWRGGLGKSRDGDVDAQAAKVAQPLVAVVAGGVVAEQELKEAESEHEGE